MNHFQYRNDELYAEDVAYRRKGGSMTLKQLLSAVLALIAAIPEITGFSGLQITI